MACDARDGLLDDRSNPRQVGRGRGQRGVAHGSRQDRQHGPRVAVVAMAPLQNMSGVDVSPVVDARRDSRGRENPGRPGQVPEATAESVSSRRYNSAEDGKRMTGVATTTMKHLSGISRVLMPFFRAGYRSKKVAIGDQPNLIDVTFVFQTILVGALITLMALLIATMLLKEVSVSVGELLGLENKSEVITFLGIAMGGVLLALQALVAYKRSKAMEDAARAQARANENTEIGQRQERLRNAIEHLGHKSDSVRLGGAYELFHLAEDNVELRGTVFDILCAHIRWTTRDTNYQELFHIRPSEEIQSLLNLLFVKKHDVFEALSADLQGSWLNGVNLDNGRLEGANLTRVRLREASLSEVNLRDSLLTDAQLQGAYIVRSLLQGAFLFNAQLQAANLGKSQMQGADMCSAKLQGTNLAMVQMQGANLIEVQMQGAHFLETNMQGARCEDTEELSGDRIIRLIGRDSELSSVAFHGGLKEDDVRSLTQSLTKRKADRLKRSLTAHVDKAESDHLPKGVISGSYTRDDAKRWVV